ncbi:MAG: cellulose synthase operon protein YhjQ/BcsQ [Pirellulales bacterium]
MSDQANELRQLMQTLAERRISPTARPRSVVVWGAQHGVGATAIAVNLAVELARHNRRVVLVDAEATAGATRLCRLHEPSAAHRSGWTGASLADVYRGRRPLSEAIRRGAHGLRVVGNSGGDSAAFAPTDEEIDVLAAAIRSLGNEADLVIVDAGWGHSPPAERLSRDADAVLVVASTTDAAIMEAYAAIKRLVAVEPDSNVSVLLSRCCAIEEADEAFARLRHGCKRFLNAAIESAGCIVEDATVADAQSYAAPFVVLSPRCEAARGIQQAAEHLLGASSTKSARSAVGGGVTDSRRGDDVVVAAHDAA